jgi:uncharacterized membrane protein YcaP (DUF421 family)
MSLWKQRSSWMDRLVDGTPLVIVENGRLLKDRMAKARVDGSDILEAARELQGLERMDQIKYAVLERAGHITIVPKRGSHTKSDYAGDCPSGRMATLGSCKARYSLV